MTEPAARPTAGGNRLWMGLGLTAAILACLMLTTLLRLRGSSAKPLPVYAQVADFTLTNQENQAVSLADLRGKIWVADIIFTRCAGPCLKMTRQMKELQQALAAEDDVRLVSLTTDPTYDSPRILKAYAEKFGADPRRWCFLTGTPRQIASLAADSLKLTALEKKPEERETPQDLFIHSTIFVVVDQRGQLRGVFETTGEGVEPEQAREQLLAAVRQLRRES
jgi:protein SCO1